MPNDENRGQRDRGLETVYRAGLAVGAEVRKIDLMLGPHYQPLAVHLEADGTLSLQGLDALRRAAPVELARQVTLFDQPSFEEYVRIFQRGNSRVYADPESLAVLAVLDDHGAPASDVEGELPYPDWCEHRATLKLLIDPSWERWAKHDQTEMGQEEFAELIEELADSIYRKDDDPADVPDARTMLTVAQRLHVTESQSAKGVVRHNGPTVSIGYHASTTGSVEGIEDVTVPTRFRLRVAPFEGAPEYWVEVRFRFRIKNASVRCWYVILGKDTFLRQAFSDLAASLKQSLAMPVLLGRL